MPLLDDDTANITKLLQEARLGNESAAEELMDAVYTGLKQVARRYMKAERGDHTLQPTAIVNEAFLRLFQPVGPDKAEWRSVPVDWQSRAHFLGVAAKQMRQILVDHGRNKGAVKRSGIKISVEDASSMAAPADQEFEKLDQLLTLMAAKDPEAAKVVELKFFGGLTDKEGAHVMDISVAKFRRHWEFARSWLRHRMGAAARA